MIWLERGTNRLLFIGTNRLMFIRGTLSKKKKMIERETGKILLKISNIEFCKNPTGGSQVVPCGQTNAAVVFHNCKHL